MEVWVWLLIAAAVVILFGWQTVVDRRKRKAALREHLERMWGGIPERKYTKEELERIASYSNLKEKNESETEIDDITWNDLEMDRIFERINYTESSAGEEYLYRLLRYPVLKADVLQERESIIAALLQDSSSAWETGRLLIELGRAKNISLYQVIVNLQALKQRGNLKHWFSFAAAIASLALLIITPPVGIMCLIAVILLNVFSYFGEKAKNDPYLTCFRYLVNLIRTAKLMGQLDCTALKPYTEQLQSLADQLKPLVRGVGFIEGNRMNGSIAEVVMDYVRMFTHLDLIKFNQMLSVVQDRMPQVLQLYELVGLLDAMRSAAAYRLSLPVYCSPVFREGTGIAFTDIYHPLLADPVTNSMPDETDVLLTGSNASGKSTFLKTVALNAIFAQSIHTCLAEQLETGFYHIYSSMALRDSLENQESYYIVEVRSLKRILDAAAQGKKVLCFVDEVLRGTNTVERIAASSRILKVLAEQKTTCFAATHDIELTNILNRYYSNYHFEEEVDAHEVRFSYRLYAGRATSRNAIRLLDMLGYQDSIVTDAQKMAEAFLATGSWNPIQ